MLLAVNTIVLDNQTKEAEVTVDGGEILEPARRRRAGARRAARPAAARRAPIVLLHCYRLLAALVGPAGAAPRREPPGDPRSTCSATAAREKPRAATEIEDQAALVAGALDQLGVQGAVVVGHSMGFAVAVALAEQASQLVDRLVNIDAGPDRRLVRAAVLASSATPPVIGQAMWRLTPDFAVEDGFADAFAPGFDVEDGFDGPRPGRRRLPGDDLHLVRRVARRRRRLHGREPLDARCATAAVPLLSIFGTEDQICDPARLAGAYAARPGRADRDDQGAGHSPNVEQPEETAALIEEFAACGARPRPRGEGSAQAAARRNKGTQKRDEPAGGCALGRERASSQPVTVLPSAKPRRRRAYCQRPPAFAHSFMCSTEQKPSATRWSPRWRTSSTWTSPSSASQCEQRGALVELGRLGQRPGLPVGALDRPGHDVLEPAEGGAPLAGRLVGAKSVARLDLRAAPRARRILRAWRR